VTIAITRLVELEAVKVSEIVITKKNKNIADHSVNRVFYATPLSFYSNYLSMLGLYQAKESTAARHSAANASGVGFTADVGS